MTSLLDAPVLACDLVRAPAGSQVTEVLLQALAATPRPDVRTTVLDLELERLRGVVRALDTVPVDEPPVDGPPVDEPPLDERPTGRPTTGRPTTGRPTTGGPTRGGPTAGGPAGSPVEARALAGVRLLAWQDITAILVLDVLPEDPAAALAAADAVAGHLVRSVLDRSQVRLLLAAWSQLAGPLPAVADLDRLADPGGLRDLFEQLQTTGSETYHRLDGAYRAERRTEGARWAPLMHAACRAVAAAGLARPVAAAQLTAARALLANSALHPMDRAAVMPAVTAHVQALATAGVAPPEVRAALSHAWTRATE